MKRMNLLPGIKWDEGHVLQKKGTGITLRPAAVRRRSDHKMRLSRMALS